MNLVVATSIEDSFNDLLLTKSSMTNATSAMDWLDIQAKEDTLLEHIGSFQYFTSVYMITLVPNSMLMWCAIGLLWPKFGLNLPKFDLLFLNEA